MDPITSYLNNNINNIQNPRDKKLENSIKSDLSKATDSELMSVCKEFEAYFTEQVFKAMDKMVPEETYIDGGNNQLKEFYKGELLQNYAKTSAEGEGLGIAKMLYESMKRNYDI
ncbi:MAG: rod-binding protein [Lachnospiraceae bacterium]|nr:rod-binding protein [Lachnospiraceae bacterium]